VLQYGLEAVAHGLAYTCEEGKRSEFMYVQRRRSAARRSGCGGASGAVNECFGLCSYQLGVIPFDSIGGPSRFVWPSGRLNTQKASQSTAGKG
jgi:hypothetical protein